mgnify:FL=1
MEKQIIELNEDLQALENEKNDLSETIDDLRRDIQVKDRQIQSIQVRFHFQFKRKTTTRNSSFS